MYVQNSRFCPHWSGWSASTTTQPSFTTTQAILITTHNRVSVRNATPHCNNDSFLELDKPPLRSVWAEPWKLWKQGHLTIWSGHLGSSQLRVYICMPENLDFVSYVHTHTHTHTHTRLLYSVRGLGSRPRSMRKAVSMPERRAYLSLSTTSSPEQRVLPFLQSTSSQAVSHIHVAIIIIIVKL